MGSDFSNTHLNQLVGKIVENQIDKGQKATDALLSGSMRGGLDPNVLKTVNDLAESRAADTKSMMLDQQVQLRAELAGAKTTIKELEDRVRQRDEELTRVQRDADSRLFDTESKRITELRAAQADALREVNAKHEDELRRHRDEAARVLSDVRERYESQITQLRVGFDTERSQLMQRLDSERTSALAARSEDARRAESSANERVQSLRDTYDARLDDIKRTSEHRIEDVRRQYESEIKMLREMRASEQTSIEQRTKIEITSIRSVAEQRIGILEAQLAEQRSETTRLRDECDRLRGEVNKPARVAITEARELIDAVTGGGDDKEGGEEPVAKDWKQTAMEAGLPMLGAIVQRLATPPAPAGQVVPNGAPPQQRALPRGPVQQPPMVAGYRRRRPPAPGQFSGPLAPGDVAVPPPPEFATYASQPPRPAKPRPMVAAAPTPSAPPPASAQLVPVMQQGEADVAAAVAASLPDGTPEPAQESAPAPASTPVIAQVDQAQLAALVGQVSMLAQSGQPPTAVAQALVAQFGAANVAQALQAVAPAQVSEFAQTLPDGSAGSEFAQYRGRKYLEELWARAGELVAKG